MAKEVVQQLKLQIQAGQANPSPPVGPALGQAGVNIMEFCKAFNAETQQNAGDLLPVVISVYQDKSFTFVCKKPPAAVLLKKAANIASGSGEPHKTKVGTLSKAKLIEVARVKMDDLNTDDEEMACRILAGTARQMAAIVAHGDRTPGLRGLTLPTLVIHGAADPLVPLAGGEATAAAIPGAELLVIEGMGHDVPRDTWPQIIPAISKLTAGAG